MVFIGFRRVPPSPDLRLWHFSDVLKCCFEKTYSAVHVRFFWKQLQFSIPINITRFRINHNLIVHIIGKAVKEVLHTFFILKFYDIQISGGIQLFLIKLLSFPGIRQTFSAR